MDRHLILSLLIVYCLASTAAALEYVTPQQTEQLKSDFSRAEAPEKSVLTSLINRDLKCDMYGVRSRLQVEREVILYRFHQESSVWKNAGAQVVQNYQWVKNELIGTQGPLTDKVRIFKGSLLAELSIQGATGSENAPTILAYSVCKLDGRNRH
jgi:hypothetical protein